MNRCVALILINGAFVSAMIGALIGQEQKRRRNDMVLLGPLRPYLSRAGRSRSTVYNVAAFVAGLFFSLRILL
ncbi:MAG TPA: hypothetical protein VMW26_06920 [Methanomassiliicoccales archaeon]|nr:hypothetical protein [Methanomassiliicoccales archaeon]